MRCTTSRNALAADEQSASDAAADEQSDGAIVVQQSGADAFDDSNEPADARTHGGAYNSIYKIIFVR